MKKLKFKFLAIIALVSIGLISGCNKENLPPELSFFAGGDLVSGDTKVTPDSTFSVKWDAQKGNNDLESFTITKDGVDLSGYPVSLSGDQKDRYTATEEITAPAQEGVYNYKFIISDEEGLSADKTIKITVEKSETPLSTEKTGQFYHIAGATGCTGAYDLVNDQDMSVSDDDAKKDMKNTDNAGAKFTGSWTAGSGNSSTYIQDNSYDYSNATVESAKSAYNSMSPSPMVNNPQVGDIYIAKVRGQSWYVIKITSLDPGDNSCNASTNNTGKITFNYKRK